MKRKISLLLHLAVPYLLILFFSMTSVLALGSMALEKYREKFIEEKNRNVTIAFEKLSRRLDSMEEQALLLVENEILQARISMNVLRMRVII